MANEPIRVGIVGAGRNTTEKHIPGLQALDRVEIISVCNRTPDSSQRVAAQFGIPRVYENWWDLIDSPDTDAIVIGTWPYLHHRATLRAFAAGKHVMCEARMARNLAEARAMLDASQAHPYLVAQVVPSPMTLGVDKTIKRLLAEGFLGDPLAIEVRAGNDFLDRESPLHWREDFDLSGFNIMSLGIWYEAVLRWVGEATSLIALGKTFVPMRRNADGNLQAVRIPDHLDVAAEMSCGAHLRMTISNVTGLGGAPTATIYGGEGSLRFVEGQLFGARRGDKDFQPIAIRPEDAASWRVEEEFINAIRGREVITHTDFVTGVKYMAFVEAVTRSMVERRQVELSY